MTQSATIEPKKLEFVAVDFAKSKWGEREFDTIVAFNMSLFWKNPVDELNLIRTYLKTNGKFFLFHQPPHNITKQTAEQAIVQLIKNRFEVIETLFKELEPAPVSCIISKPKN